MAGHSKWHNIKNRKAAVDAVKAKIFGQLARQIRVAVREGGSGDPQFNSTLRVYLDKARAENMPKEKVQKAIDAGLGKGSAGELKETVYEGFGPGGVAFLVATVTNNPNRTTSEIKEIFSKHGGSVGAPGSAMYLFSRGSDGRYVPTMPYMVEPGAQQTELQDLLEALQENEDVEEVFASAEWTVPAGEAE